LLQVKRSGELDEEEGRGEGVEVASKWWREGEGGGGGRRGGEGGGEVRSPENFPGYQTTLLDSHRGSRAVKGPGWLLEMALWEGEL
jgi:hypothetical protein